ncbi:MAG: dihydrodipicolinate synthase family protein [Methylobacteriaceae bacterium]|nr:dihydrodipicolinate synthase family protein [Methylobacteriaceae bacterium]
MAFDLSQGIIAAPVTPFNSDESVDWATLDRYMAAIAAGGPQGVAMNMAASEGGSLTEAEQIEVVRRTRAAAAGACAVISGVVAQSTRQATDLAKRLVEAGADALVVFPPLPTFVSKPLAVETVVAYHRAIAEAAGVPIIAFQTPFVDYPAGTIRGLASIPSIVALKDAAFNVDRTVELLEEAETTPIKVLTGNDTFILEAMLMGCSGALIGFAGTATAELVRMHALAVAGKITEAYAIWNALGPLARICWRRPLRDYRVRMKYTLMRQGVIPCDAARAPQPPIAAKDKDDLDRCFERYGLDDARYLPDGGRLRGSMRAAE